MSKRKAFILCLISLFLVVVVLVLGKTVVKTRDPHLVGIQTRIDAKEICRFIEGYSFSFANGTNNWAMWPNDDCEKVPSNNQTACLEFANWIGSFDKYARTPQEEAELSHFKKLITDASGRCRWTFMLNVSNETPDNIPILMTSNVDPALLTALMTGNEEGGGLRGTLEHGMFLNKMLAAVFVNPDYFSSGRAKRHGVTEIDTRGWPNAVSYLTPTGVVSVCVRKNGANVPKK